MIAREAPSSQRFVFARVSRPSTVMAEKVDPATLSPPFDRDTNKELRQPCSLWYRASDDDRANIMGYALQKPGAGHVRVRPTMQ